MGSLKSLVLKSVYRSETDNILRDFYVPALGQSSSYDRAVGYFSASMLTYAAQGLSSFVKNQGTMRLVIGSSLEADEVEAIDSGYEQRRLLASLGERFVRELNSVSNSLLERRLELLSWLVASGRLEIRVAIRRMGMYHEKIGVFRDDQGDAVVFQGSANETRAALIPDFNFESINVFPTWRDELTDHFEPYIGGFARLWENRSPGTTVLPFPEVARDHLLEMTRTDSRLLSPSQELQMCAPELIESNETGLPRPPEVFGDDIFELRPHQREALAEWKANDFAAIMPLATGAGKTIAAAFGATRVFEGAGRLAVVVAVPYTVLADQWCEVLERFNMDPIRAYHSESSWYERLHDFVEHYRSGAINFGCVVVVNHTFRTNEGFRREIARLPDESLLWIGDECHHHAGTSFAELLPSNASFRLGLSATPLSEFDPDSNERLQTYYGPLLRPYSLENALADGVLTPYEYGVIEVQLTPDELEKYVDLSKEIGRLSAGAVGPEALRGNTALMMRLFERARLIANCSNKVEALKGVLGEHRPTPLTLFYCGDGTTEDEISGEERRQIELVVDALRESGWRCAPYTSHETRRNREATMRAFECGDLDALVAIRCLDEGVDIPACRSAYILASSRSHRQGVQRRGRILRRAPGKTSAELVDFLVTPGVDSPVGQRLVRSELRRAREFSALASNRVNVWSDLLSIATKYSAIDALEDPEEEDDPFVWDDSGSN